MNERPPAAQRPPTVLVVDDELDQLQLISTRLRRLGCRTLEAPSAEHALELLASETPDIAVIDLRLPGMDGGTLTARIRSGRPSCRVVIASVLDTRDYPEADAVLPKPFTTDELADVLRSLGALPPVGPDPTGAGR